MRLRGVLLEGEEIEVGIFEQVVGRLEGKEMEWGPFCNILRFLF